MNKNLFFLALLTIALVGGLLFTTCSPIGFLQMPESADSGSGTGGDGDDPGTIFGDDGSPVYPLVIKNMTQSVGIDSITFTRNDEEKTDSGPGAGKEKSVRLPEGDYGIILEFKDPRDTAAPDEVKTFNLTKVILPKSAGTANYIYFYRSKGQGIAVDTDDGGKTAGSDADDSDTVNNPDPTDPGNVGAPEYSLTVINYSKSADIKEIAFAPGGRKMSNINRATSGKATKKIATFPQNIYTLSITYQDDKPGSPSPTGEISNIQKEIVPLHGVNRLHFFRNIHTGLIDVSIDNEGDDIDGKIDPGDTEGENEGDPKTGEGDEGDENKDIVITPPGDRSLLGVVKVHNLSRSVAIDGVQFERGGITHTLNTINAGGVHTRSIVLSKSLPLWTATVSYTEDSTGHTEQVNVTVKPYGAWGYVNHLYFYKGKDGRFHFDDQTPNPGNVDIDEPGGGGGGGNEGDSPGSITDKNRSYLGLVIVKNVSKDQGIDRLTFTQSSRAWAMTPGPKKSDQKSILLRAGSWATVANYTASGTGYTSTEKNVIVTAGAVSYMYFYKTRGGDYQIAAEWPPLANDAASDNENPDIIIGEDEGWLHIRNLSSSVIIDRIQYQNAIGVWTDLTIPGPNGTQGTVPPGGESDPDIVAPKGLWAFHFKIVGKQSYGVSVSKTVRARQVTTIDYTDSLENVINLPSGSGLVRVRNNSTFSVEKMIVYNRAGGSSKIEISNAQWEPVGPIGTGGTAEKIIMGVAQNEPYVIQLILNKSGNKKSMDFVHILHNQIVQLQVTEDDVGNGGTGGIDDPDYEGGGLIVNNAYNGGQPMKIFKIVLKQNNISMITIDKAATPLYPGQQNPIDNIEEGLYNLEIVAGVYTWEVYNANAIAAAGISGGNALNESTITYKCGEIFIAEKYRKYYFFNVPPGQEKDMYGRQGVQFQVSYSVGSDDYPIEYVEFVIPPAEYWDTRNDPSKPNVPWDTTSLHFKGDRTDGVHTYKVWPGGPYTNSPTGVVLTPAQYIIYSNGTSLSRYGVSNYEFMLPPGKYWVRAKNAQHYWEGRGASSNYSNRWAIIDASAADGSRIYLTVGNTVGIDVFGLASTINISGQIKPNWPYPTSTQYYCPPTSTLKLSNVDFKVYQLNATNAPLSLVNCPVTIDVNNGNYMVSNIMAGVKYGIYVDFDFVGGRYKGKRLFTSEAAMATSQTLQDIALPDNNDYNLANTGVFGQSYGVHGWVRTTTGTTTGGNVPNAKVQLMERTSGHTSGGTVTAASELVPVPGIDPVNADTLGKFTINHVPTGYYYLKVTANNETRYGPVTTQDGDVKSFYVSNTWYGDRNGYTYEFGSRDVNGTIKSSTENVAQNARVRFADRWYKKW